MDNANLQRELSSFARNVVKQSRRRLTMSGRRDTNKLYDSLGYDVKVHRNSFSLAFFMEEHGEYVDKGVRGKKSISRAPKSPFRFGSGRGKKGGLTKSIEKWTKRKGIQFRDKKGRFVTNQSTVFLIARSIYNKGIKPSMFFTKPFEDSFKKLPNEVVEKFGLDVEKFLESSIEKAGK